MTKPLRSYLATGTALGLALLAAACTTDVQVQRHTCFGAPIRFAQLNRVTLATDDYLEIEGQRFSLRRDFSSDPNYEMYRFGPPSNDSRIAYSTAKATGPSGIQAVFLQIDAGQSEWLPCFNNTDAQIVGPQEQ